MWSRNPIPVLTEYLPVPSSTTLAEILVSLVLRSTRAWRTDMAELLRRCF